MSGEFMPAHMGVRLWCSFEAVDLEVDAHLQRLPSAVAPSAVNDHVEMVERSAATFEAWSWFSP